MQTNYTQHSRRIYPPLLLCTLGENAHFFFLGIAERSCAWLIFPRCLINVSPPPPSYLARYVTPLKLGTTESFLRKLSVNARMAKPILLEGTVQISVQTVQISQLRCRWVFFCEKSWTPIPQYCEPSKTACQRCKLETTWPVFYRDTAQWVYTFLCFSFLFSGAKLRQF